MWCWQPAGAAWRMTQSSSPLQFVWQTAKNCSLNFSIWEKWVRSVKHRPRYPKCWNQPKIMRSVQKREWSLKNQNNRLYKIRLSKLNWIPKYNEHLPQLWCWQSAGAPCWVTQSSSLLQFFRKTASLTNIACWISLLLNFKSFLKIHIDF